MQRDQQRVETLETSLREVVDFKEKTFGTIPPPIPTYPYTSLFSLPPQAVPRNPVQTGGNKYLSLA